jgi:hypothetical protein
MREGRGDHDSDVQPEYSLWCAHDEGSGRLTIPYGTRLAYEGANVMSGDPLFDITESVQAPP